VDADLLRATWTEVARYGDEAIAWFYATLALDNPGVDALFPSDMRAQRAKLISALDLVVEAADNPDAVATTLQRLGRDHRRFGATADHYPAVKHALLDTLAHFLDDAWTDDVHKAWSDALDLVAGIMTAAAHEADAAGEPASWDTPVVRVDRRGDDGAWIVVDPGPTYPWEPGCRVPIAITGQPGTERLYTPDGIAGTTRLAFYVRRTSDPVSLALLNHPGDRLRLAAPFAPEEPA
jgi:hemoglobin-like flavoprotein